FVPCLLIDEKRKDVARFDLGCCWKETTEPGRIISGPPRVHSRRDSFVLEQLSDTDHPASIADETWNDNGDEARSPPCSRAAPFVGKTVPTQPNYPFPSRVPHPGFGTVGVKEEQAETTGKIAFRRNDLMFTNLAHDTRPKIVSLPPRPKERRPRADFECLRLSRRSP
ncbi:unnamed protein product, partial [Ectocarpus sp. 13 AM-2016]